jgi:hypothetical protein
MPVGCFMVEATGEPSQLGGVHHANTDRVAVSPGEAFATLDGVTDRVP